MVNGFQIRFFTEKQIQGLASAEGFEIQNYNSMTSTVHFNLIPNDSD
jgi:hypothetical protein